MSERVLTVKVLGDASSLQRSFLRAGTSTKQFNHELTAASRGALAGSGVFRGLGRSIAFASGGFLAFASAGQFLRTSIDAAKQAAVTQKQLGAQFKASGKDLGLYQGQIDKTANRLSLLAGFNRDELTSSFVTIFRASGNVRKSLRDVGLAADIARARGISLAAASLIVGKVEAGNIGILRRSGVQVAKNASVEKALLIARLRFAGQAAAGTTAQERFGAVLHNTEEIIGAGILPVLNKYLASGAIWLTQMNESGKLQKDVASAAHGVTVAVSDAVTVTRDAITVARIFTGALGGVKTTLEVIGGLKLAGLIGGLTTANTKVGTLRGSLLGLNEIRIAAIVVPVEIKLIPDTFHGKVPKGIKGALVGALNFGPLVAGEIFRAFKGSTAKAAIPNTSGMSNDPLHDAANRAADASAAAAATSKRGLNLTASQRNTFFDNAVARILTRGGLGTIQQQLAAIQKASALISERIAATKDVTRKLNLEDQLLQLRAQSRDLNAQAASEAAAAQQRLRDLAAQHKARLKEIAAIKLGQRTARQFRELGLSATGDVVTPGVANLKKQLASLTARAVGTSIDTPALQAQLARFRKVLSEGLVPQDVRAKIRDMLQGIRDELGKGAQNLTGYRHQSTLATLKRLGLTLTPEEKRRVESVLSQLGAGNTVPGRTSQAFALASGQTIVMHNPQFHGVTDVKKLRDDLAKLDKRRAVPRRGPYAGLH